MLAMDVTPLDLEDSRGRLRVSVSITTHNRRADLERTLERLAELDPKPLEIIVCADGCTDGTEALISQEYPAVRLLKNTPGRGSVYSRDRILREAQGELVLSLDDDSYPMEKGFLGCVSALFERSPKLAAATFPQRSDEFPASMQQMSFGESLSVGSFTSSGTVLRRSVYLKLPGFPEVFFHAYEEPDYSLQCIAAGYEVILYTALTVRHHYSGVERNEIRTHHRHARNEFLSIVMRCPWWGIPFFAAFRGIRQLQYSVKRGRQWIVREPAWWGGALRRLPTALKYRKAVPMASYLRWCRLMRSPEAWSSTLEAPRPGGELITES